MVQIIATDIIQVGPLFPFLETAIYSFDAYVTGGVPIFSGIVIFLFSFYLVLSTIKGIMIISKRIPFLSINPLILRDSSLLSILLNSGLLLLMSFSVHHFIIQTLSNYFAETDFSSNFLKLIIVIYVGIIQNINIIGYVYSNNIQIYVFFILTFIFGFISFILECICPIQSKKEHQLESLLLSIEK